MALGEEIVTRIVGYSLTPGNFNLTSPNLPIRAAILAEANETNQSTLELDDDGVPIPVQITSLAQAATLGGFGSPIYQIAKIMFPTIGGIPVWVYPQLKASGASNKQYKITPTGTATGNGTHYVVISGRYNISGQSYAVNIESGDTIALINAKIADTVNSALGSPLSASDASYYTHLTSKWKGATANDIVVEMDTNDTSIGVTYAVNSLSTASGTPAVTASLGLFGNNWNTHVINSYGLVSATMTELENFNGTPVIGVSPASGRYLPTVFKPFIAYSGSTIEDPSTITSTRKLELTIKVSPAPLSDGLPMEAAANDCLLACLVAQNTPHLDTIGQAYPDMPTPTAIGLMSSWEERQRMILAGCSTVDLVNGAYTIMDPVTTYHPDGEVPPQWRYARIIVIDWNVRFTYLYKENINVLDHVIANDNDRVAATRVIKPKIWKAILSDMADELVLRGLIVDAAFMTESITVAINTVNPDRLQTFFRYKRSGVVRVSDTTVEAGFNVGTLIAN